MMRLLLVAVVLCCIGRCLAYDIPDRYTEAFNGKSLTPVEGIWLTNSGSVLSIVGDKEGNIVVTLLECTDPDIETPAVVGKGSFVGAKNTYYINFMTKSALGQSKNSFKTNKYYATVSDNNLLNLVPEKKLSFNFLRLFPYLFRIGVESPRAPYNKNAATRLWPRTGTPQSPVIL